MAYLGAAIRAALGGNMEAQRQLTVLCENEPSTPSQCLELLAAEQADGAVQYFGASMVLTAARRGHLGPPGPAWEAVLQRAAAVPPGSAAGSAVSAQLLSSLAAGAVRSGAAAAAESAVALAVRAQQLASTAPQQQQQQQQQHRSGVVPQSSRSH